MNRTIKIILLIILVINSPLFSQKKEITLEDLNINEPIFIRVKTSRGATFQGKLYDLNDQFIIIVDKDGQMITLLTNAISDLWEIDPYLDKKFYFQDSADNRLLIIPTGFPMEKGEFHIADQEIAAVNMSYGVNEHFSIWGGISIPGALLSARFTTALGDKSALSLGTFAGLSWMGFKGLLIPYAVFSLGTPENNFTTAAGAVFSFDENGFKFDAAVLVLGGKLVLSDTVALVTENWIIWGKMDDYNWDTESSWDPVPIIIAPGVALRIAGEKFSWDIGVALPLLVSREREKGSYTIQGVLGGFIPIPILSLTYRID